MPVVVRTRLYNDDAFWHSVREGRDDSDTPEAEAERLTAFEHNRNLDF